MIGMQLEPGMYGVTKKFSLAADGTRFTYTANRGEEFLVYLIGSQKTQNETPELNEFKGLLAGLGFVGSSDLEECLAPEELEKIKEFMQKKYGEQKDESL